MAKLKTDTAEVAQNSENNTFQETPQEQAEETKLPADGEAPNEGSGAVPTEAEAPQPKEEDTSTSKKGTQKQQTEKQSDEKIDDQTDGILKSFSGYDSIYIDKQGGVFTSDTPKSIRGTATLYKNPHYKQQ